MCLSAARPCLVRDDARFLPASVAASSWQAVTPMAAKVQSNFRHRTNLGRTDFDRGDSESHRHPEVELRQVPAVRRRARATGAGDRPRVGFPQRLPDQGLRRDERARLRLVQPREAEVRRRRVPPARHDVRRADQGDDPAHGVRHARGRRAHRARHQRAGGLLRRDPADDGDRHVHHQRHRARRRLAARTAARASSSTTTRARRTRAASSSTRRASSRTAARGSTSSSTTRTSSTCASTGVARCTPRCCSARSATARRSCSTTSTRPRPSTSRRAASSRRASSTSSSPASARRATSRSAPRSSSRRTPSSRAPRSSARRTRTSTALPIELPELIGKVSAGDVVDKETGEVLLECNEEVTEVDARAPARGERQPSFRVLFIDGLNVGPYLRDTLIADKVKTTEDAIMEIYRRLRPAIRRRSRRRSSSSTTCSSIPSATTSRRSAV